jgi:hypothetical protein
MFFYRKYAKTIKPKFALKSNKTNPSTIKNIGKNASKGQ